MEKLQIEGGVPLVGEVQASGAKNAMTKLLVASLLSDKPCTFYNVPDIGDVRVTVELCQEIGMEVEWDHRAGIPTARQKKLKHPISLSGFQGRIRIPILMIGALLGRTEEDVIVPTVGGCAIGRQVR